MRRALITVVAFLVAGMSVATLAGCGSADQRWSNGDFSVSLPSGWTPDASDGEGFTVVRAPTGPGRLAFLKIVDKDPKPLTADLALALGLPGIESAGLPTGGITPKAVAADHYLLTAEGSSHGERVVAAVHVFAGGVILIGYFHSPDADDPNVRAATSILASLLPE